jgi:hypothetical protein
MILYFRPGGCLLMVRFVTGCGYSDGGLRMAFGLVSGPAELTQHATSGLAGVGYGAG